MIRKVIDIAVVCFFVGFVCVGFAAGQVSPGAGEFNRELAQRKGVAVSVIDVSSYTYIELEEKGGAYGLRRLQ